MKVLSIPHLYQLKDSTDGISQVIRAYFKHLPDFGIELVLPDEKDYDLKAVHAGVLGSDCDIAHLHGLYWTADYAAPGWEFRANQKIVESLRSAISVTVPSSWVAETLQRDLHLNPTVVPHGIDADEWQPGETGDYILWNKNRIGDVCDPDPVYHLAAAFPNGRFITTFAPKDREKLRNLHDLGVVHHETMKEMIGSAMVYLATTKETFGIGILEALACGVPVLGFAHGGVKDLVTHGETGYLAPPGNYEALGEGLNYCIKHRHVLSQNAREAAKLWPWENAAEKIAQVYQHTLDQMNRPNDVSVIIPVYNKTLEQLMRAVESACNQTRTPSVVVVDDGSDPALSETYRGALKQLAPQVTYIRQENKGVAHARNRGIAETRSAYICCLDSDDAIKPEFLERCCAALDVNRSLGIAYTKIHVIEPSGREGISNWPEEFDFDRQCARGNQVPTCCVFRRIAWERTGGYRQRYAPDGAGAEDGELWLRMGALGFNAQLVTKKPLFVYSVGSGQVSGNPSYREVDWLQWHPWTKDPHHPIASLAKPAFLSHPVRQYDEPVVSVIIPVGPGHIQHLWNALDSLEAQTFRRWEAIVVMDHTPPENEFQSLKDAFPFVKWTWTQYGKTNKPQGPGYARNRGAEMARGKFLVFLDADDWLYPEYLESVLGEWRGGEPAIIYTDYVGKAIVDQPDNLAPDLQRRIYSRNPDTNLTILGFRAADYNCERAQRQPEGNNPWLWTNVTALIPAPWHRDIGGFDEDIPSWEDALYHFKMARQGKCYRRLARELYVYCLHFGKRRDKGRQDFKSLLEWIQRELDEEEIVACSGCSGKNSTPTGRTARVLASPTRTAQPVTEEFILCVYNHPNRGDHPVIGGAAFAAPIQGVSMVKVREGFKINYGNKAGSGQTKFRVHQRDIQLQPHLFVPVQRTEIQGVAEELQPLPAPTYAEQPRGILGDLGDSPSRAPTPAPTPAPAVIETNIGGEVELVEVPDQAPPSPSTAALQSLPGIGPATAEAMAANGISSAADILTLSVEDLCQYPGIAENRAEMILAAALKFGERGGDPGGILSLEAGLNQ